MPAVSGHPFSTYLKNRRDKRPVSYTHLDVYKRQVYYDTSLKLAVSEFSIVSRNFSSPCKNAAVENICGIDYLTFDFNGEMMEGDVKAVSCLSFFYALFALERRGGQTVLLPVARNFFPFIDETMGSMLKYTGKTNELFTKTLINAAYFSQPAREHIRLLDPVAGKGTTLFEGLSKGFDVYGIEIGSGVVNEACRFTKRYLENARYKFEYNSVRISGPNKSFSARKSTFETAKTKEAFKGGGRKTIEFIAGNSIYAHRFYRKNFFDVIVGDLPYGVQHSSVTNEKQSSMTRNPSELLRECLPAWKTVLKPEGAIALAWNCSVLSRSAMEDIFEEFSMDVLKDSIYLGFRHRVDQSITRDIIVAKKI